MEDDQASPQTTMFPTVQTALLGKGGNLVVPPYKQADPVLVGVDWQSATLVVERQEFAFDTVIQVSSAVQSATNLGSLANDLREYTIHSLYSQ